MTLWKHKLYSDGFKCLSSKWRISIKASIKKFTKRRVLTPIGQYISKAWERFTLNRKSVHFKKITGLKKNPLFIPVQASFHSRRHGEGRASCDYKDTHIHVQLSEYNWTVPGKRNNMLVYRKDGGAMRMPYESGRSQHGLSKFRCSSLITPNDIC